MSELPSREIDVQQLMAQIRSDVERRKSAAAVSADALVSTPATTAPPFYPLRVKFDAALDRARQKNHVSSRIPSFFHPLFRNQGGFNFQVLHALELQAQQIEHLREELANLQQASRKEISQLQELLNENLNHIRASQAEASQQRERLNRELKLLQEQRNILQQDLLELQRRVDSDLASTEMEAFYLAFENRFRGSREEIKERAKFYLTHLSTAGVGSASQPVLDLGCGRGEWLELLRDCGYSAHGADSNARMIESCQEAGLDVHHADVLQYLQSLPERSQGAITAFHLIEHLPIGTLLDLVREIRRCLQPGGVVIMETPNPECLTVSASNFWCDPTHRRPVFPFTANAILEYYGFTGVEVLRLERLPFNPDFVKLLPRDHPLSAALNPVLEIVKAHFVVPPDFAVVGHQPRERDSQ